MAAGNPLSRTFTHIPVATPGYVSSTSITARTPPTNPLHYCPAPNKPRCRHTAHPFTNANDIFSTFCITTSVLLPETAVCLCIQLGCGSFTCDVL